MNKSDINNDDQWKKLGQKFLKQATRLKSVGLHIIKQYTLNPLWNLKNTDDNQELPVYEKDLYDTLRLKLPTKYKNINVDGIDNKNDEQDEFDTFIDELSKEYQDSSAQISRQIKLLKHQSLSNKRETIQNIKFDLESARTVVCTVIPN